MTPALPLFHIATSLILEGICLHVPADLLHPTYILKGAEWIKLKNNTFQLLYFLILLLALSIPFRCYIWAVKKQVEKTLQDQNHLEPFDNFQSQLAVPFAEKRFAT